MLKRLEGLFLTFFDVVEAVCIGSTCFTKSSTLSTEGVGVTPESIERHGVNNNLTNIFQMGWFNHQLAVDF